ncbi:MAG: UPF0223 family protein [Bacilli bacterium]|nr:UPF0223 family protein [Bacilli bacterium]
MHENEYTIDYTLFSVDEVIKIINFFKLIETIETEKINKDLLIRKHNEYRNILNNITLEKEYDKMLFKKCGISIYRTLKKLS